MKLKPPTANEITAELLLRVAREVPYVWLYRNNRVNAKAIGKGGRLRHVSAGIDGQGDLSGLIAPTGRRLEVEVKAEYSKGRDRQSPVQEAFQNRIESMGGVYLLVERIGWANGKPDVSAVVEVLRGVAKALAICSLCD